MQLVFQAHAFQIALVLMFVAVMLLLEAAYLFWKAHRGTEAQRVGQRLKAIATAHQVAQAAVLKDRRMSELPLLERWLQARPRAQWLHRQILQAGLDWTVGTLLLGCVVAAGLALAVAIRGFRLPVGIAFAVALAAAALPVLYVAARRSRRMSRIEKQLPEALDFIGRALRSGHAFSSALLMVGQEMPDPIAAEFRAVHDEINFGVSLQQALANLSERVPLTDMRYFVVAVLILRDSGGNLTEVLGNLGRLIRERLKLVAKVRVLSADGRFSALILVALPFALGAGMNALNPEFMSPLWTDPIGITMLQFLLGFMVLGVLILRRITRIRI
jgi:tight adherence protein B